MQSCYFISSIVNHKTTKGVLLQYFSSFVVVVVVVKVVVVIEIVVVVVNLYLKTVKISSVLQLFYKISVCY